MSQAIRQQSGPPSGIRLPLFDQFERTDMATAERTEEGFDFWNRSAWPEIAQLRAVVEGWYTRYADSDAHRLRKEFRSRGDSQHRGALLELFIHEHLLRAGFRVECQPEVPHSSNKPDFLVFDNGAPAFYVEAKSKQPSKAEARTERLRQEALGAISELRSPNYLVTVVISGTPTQSVPVGKLGVKRDLAAWLAAKDHAAELEQRRLNPYFRSEPFNWEAVGLSLEFRAFPRGDSRGDVSIPLFGAEIDGDAHLVATDAEIAAVVDEKAAKYGTLGLPYLIAIGLLDFTTDRDDVAQGLGSAWGTSDRPRNPKVSGVLLAFVPNMAAAVRHIPLLVMNPSAHFPLQHGGRFKSFERSLRDHAESTEI